MQIPGTWRIAASARTAKRTCTNAPNQLHHRRCDPVAVEILRAQLLWLEGADPRAVRRALIEALRLLDE